MEKQRKRIFDIIQIGNRQDIPSAAFDIFIVVVILLNLFITIFDTFEQSLPLKPVLDSVEAITMFIFLFEFLLRLWTADYLFPRQRRMLSVIAFLFSFYGLIDFFTIAPYFLPFFLPSGAVAFRILRVIRIFRLFKINAQYDAFNVILDVLNQKREQIISSLCMILILMAASSLCMYSLEHEAQPEAFANAFSGIWWSMSTLLTVGYGDIYPITTAGRIMAIMIAFLGVGLVAIPTGIISAGFVEQFTKMDNETKKERRFGMNIVSSELTKEHPFCGRKAFSLVLPPDMTLIMLLRDKKPMLVDHDTVLLAGDVMVLAEKNRKDSEEVSMTELTILKDHPFVGRQVKDLDLSRLETVVMIRRNNRIIRPHDDTRVGSDDVLLIYKKEFFS